MNLSGTPVDYLIAFLGGLLVSFNPCIYPLLPVTISFIGITPSSKKITGFILSFIYVTGIALIYAVLGIIAGLSGSIFGKVSASPLVRIIVGIIFVFLGLSLWGIFPLRTLVFKPGFSIKKTAWAKVFFLGLSSGLVITPCVSPILGSILILAASRKNIFYAGTLLLSFAYGMGFVLIMAGTFSSILLGLPKSGDWMNKLKNFSGLILIGVGLYFIFMGIRGW